MPSRRKRGGLIRSRQVPAMAQPSAAQSLDQGQGAIAQAEAKQPIRGGNRHDSRNMTIGTSALASLAARPAYGCGNSVLPSEAGMSKFTG